MTYILGPNGDPITKEISVTQSSTFRLMGSADVGGAVPHPRRYDWKTYYDMYEQHPTVNAAINKLVKVATNTGFEFTPRSVLDPIAERELKKAREFFDSLKGFKETLQIAYLHLLIFGDAFLYIVPKRNGMPSRLKALAPWTVNIKVKKNGEVMYYYQRDPDEVDRDKGIRFKPHEIIHIKQPNPKDQIYGLSPLEALKAVVLTDIMVERFNRNFFKNGASTGTVFVFNGATNEQLERMRRWIHEKYVGTENSHLPFVIDGDVRIERSIAENQELGFEKGRDAIRAQILAVLDVPPAKIGYMETANRSNSKEQDKSFRTEAIMPLQFLVETALSDQLIRDVLGLDNVLFNHSDADVRDRQEQMDLWKSAVQNGIMNINEVRKLMGLNEIRGGDVNYVMSPTGAVPVVDLELYFKIPNINTDKIPPGLHDDHDHPGSGGASSPRGTHLVGPDPKTDPGARGRNEVLEAPATKSVGDPSRIHTVLTRLNPTVLDHGKRDKPHLKKMWVTALECHRVTKSDGYKDVADLLQQAVKADDDDLVDGYIECAKDALLPLMEQWRREGAHVTTTSD